MAAADPASNTVAIMAAIAQSGTELTAEQEAAVNQAVSAQMAIIANEQSSSIQTITNDLSALSSLNGIDASAITQQVTALQNSISWLLRMPLFTAARQPSFPHIRPDWCNHPSPAYRWQIAPGCHRKRSKRLPTPRRRPIPNSATVPNNWLRRKSLTEGNTQVSAGLQTLNEKTGPLAAGAAKLKDGTEALANGTTQLVEKGSLLTDGTSQLAAGAEKISDGSGQLADGSSQLNAGLISLLSGTNQLAPNCRRSVAPNEVDATESTYAMMLNRSSRTRLKRLRSPTTAPRWHHI